MRNNTPRSNDGAPVANQPLLILILAALFFIGLWWLSDYLTQASAEPQATAESSDSAPWPTIPPTIPSGNTSSAPAIVPTVPTPRWEEHLELTVVEFTLTSVQTVGEEEARFFGINGRDRVTLRVTGQIRGVVDLTKMSSSDVQRDGNTISLVLPPVEFANPPAVIDVEILETQQRLISSSYSGLETQAIERAQSDIYQQIAANTALKKVVEDAAVKRLTGFLIDTAGFKDVQITFR